MPKQQRMFAKILWGFAILVGVSLLILGPVSALRALTPASGTNLTSSAPNIGSVLSPEVAMAVALFGFGLIRVYKAYSKVRFRAAGIRDTIA